MSRATPNRYESYQVSSREPMRGGTMQECENCQKSLDDSEGTLPWEDGDNSYAYVTCRHCGHEKIMSGFGGDD